MSDWGALVSIFALFFLGIGFILSNYHRCGVPCRLMAGISIICAGIVGIFYHTINGHQEVLSLLTYTLIVLGVFLLIVGDILNQNKSGDKV